jgi:hypothetical protein
MPSEHDGASGSIEEFDPVDSIGTMVLDDGTRVRFGATACKGFLPVVGARLRLVEGRPHPRHGLKAKRLELIDTAVEHHARTARAYGVQQPAPKEQRTAATRLGWVTVLLDTPLPGTDGELNGLARSLGLDGVRFVLEPSGDLQIESGGQSIQAFAVGEPIDERRLDLTQLASDFSRGRAFLSLSLGKPSEARKMERLNPQGVSRSAELARIASALCTLGPGVVLDLAEGLVRPSDDFIRLAADTERPELLWSAMTVGHGGSYLRSRGMPCLGAPEVAMRLAGDDLDEKAALLGGASRDLAQGWIPVSGDTLAYEMGGQSYSYRMFELGTGWWLHDGHPDETKAAHHFGMWLAAAERLAMRRVGVLDGTESSAPPHYVDAFTGLGTAMVTNGLAFAEQPGGTVEEGNQRVELMCLLDRDGDVHGSMLSYFGALMFHQAGDQPLRPWHGLHNGPDSGFPPELETMMVVPRDSLVIWPGHEAQLFQLVAVNRDEYEQLHGNAEAGARWLKARDQAKDWSSYHERFNSFLAE